MVPLTPDSLARNPNSRIAEGHATETECSQTASPKTCLIVMPWSLRFTGGVNEVVKSLIRGMESGRDLTPLVMVTCTGARVPDWDSRQSFETVYMDLPEPDTPEALVRGYLAFLFRLPGRLLQLRALLVERNVTIVNLHYPNLNGLFFLILRWLGWYRGAILLSFHLGDARRAVKTSGLTRLLWKWMLRHSDRMISPSQELLNDLRAIDAPSEDRFAVINNGVNFELFSEKPVSLEKFPAELVGRPVLMSVGNFEERKGHQTLLRAFPKVLERFPDAAIVMIGAKFPYLESLRQLATDLGLEKQAFFFENLPHDTLPSYLSRASVFALATSSETFPLAILEAGAAGVPVVSTWAPGVPELVTDQVTGRLVNVGDVEGFAANILELLEHPQEAQRLAGNMRRQIQENLTWTHHYRRYLALYRDLSSFS